MCKIFSDTVEFKNEEYHQKQRVMLDNILEINYEEVMKLCMKENVYQNFPKY